MQLKKLCRVSGIGNCGDAAQDGAESISDTIFTIETLHCCPVPKKQEAGRNLIMESRI